MGNEFSCCQSAKERESISSSDGRSGSTDAASGLRRRPNPRSSLNEMLRKPSIFKTPDMYDGPSSSTASYHYNQPSQSSFSTGDISSSPSSASTAKNHHKKKSSISSLIPPTESDSSQRRRNSSQRDIKILLLGTGESGKSTILKQMRILHKGGFSLDERANFRLDIYRNIIEGMQQIIRAISELDLDYGTEENQNKVEIYSQFLELLTPPEYEEWDGIPFSILEALKFLWIDSGLQKIYGKLMHMAYIIDSAPYFFDELDRVGAAGYVPTDADIVRARTTTTGISEVTFKSRYFNIKMVDVGGQRSERDKKWVQCFENVTCVIFCVSLSEYDQVLLEDVATNRMLESFQLFEDVVNSQWFLNSSIVLFLNKTDLFCKKISTIPLSEYFEDFTGDDCSFEQAAEFLRDKFLALNQYRLQIYPYLTCATDTENISMVFQAVEETVLANALRDTGIF
jgi:guanine nucleotide-binding protein G(i) subunit alpha